MRIQLVVVEFQLVVIKFQFELSILLIQLWFGFEHDVLHRLIAI